MARKTGSGGPPENRSEEEPWQPEGSGEPLNRTLDLGADPEVEEIELIYGDIVRDFDVDDSERYVVVNTPDKRVDEWDVGGQTLDENSECPPDDDVVIVVIERILDKRIPDWKSREKEIPLSHLRNEVIPFDAFPSLSLGIVEWGTV
jgi:hypothetical protein